MWRYSGGYMGQQCWWYVEVVRVWFGWYLGGNSGLGSDVGSLGRLEMIRGVHVFFRYGCGFFL